MYTHTHTFTSTCVYIYIYIYIYMYIYIYDYCTKVCCKLIRITYCTGAQELRARTNKISCPGSLLQLFYFSRCLIARIMFSVFEFALGLFFLKVKTSCISRIHWAARRRLTCEGRTKYFRIVPARITGQFVCPFAHAYVFVYVYM
jgi:hypothetical protein